MLCEYNAVFFLFLPPRSVQPSPSKITRPIAIRCRAMKAPTVNNIHYVRVISYYCARLTTRLVTYDVGKKKLCCLLCVVIFHLYAARSARKRFTGNRLTVRLIRTAFIGSRLQYCAAELIFNRNVIVFHTYSVKTTVARPLLLIVKAGRVHLYFSVYTSKVDFEKVKFYDKR